jgi:hypothetical protein
MSPTQTSFTFGATIGTEEQNKIKELQEYAEKLETLNNQLKADLFAQKKIDEDTHKNIDQILYFN